MYDHPRRGDRMIPETPRNQIRSFISDVHRESHVSRLHQNRIRVPSGSRIETLAAPAHRRRRYLALRIGQDIQIHRLRHFSIAGIIRVQVVAAIEGGHELLGAIGVT
jgi:hypothetical protein